MTEKNQHDLLFVITAFLFIIFATGSGVPVETPTDTIVIPG